MFDCCLVESYSRKKRQKKGSKFGVPVPVIYGIWGCPPCDPKSNNPTQKEWLKAISMVVDIETEDGLKRHAVMVVTKKIQLAHADLLYYKRKNILLQ